MSKYLTKSKTATIDLALPVTQHWEKDGVLRVAALVRAAAATLAQQELRSSGFRGRDTLGIGTLMSEGDSTIWVDQEGMGTWSVGLGFDTSAGKTLDWQLGVVITEESSGDVAHLTTSNVLTLDGALVNSKPYQELRGLLETTLPTLRPPTPKAETAVSRQGLSAAVPPLADGEMEQYEPTFIISTTLDAEVITERLGLLHFRRTGSEPLGPWLIGLASTDEVGSASLEILPDGQGRRLLRISVTLPPAHLALARAVAARQGRRFAALALALLKKQDESATMQTTATQPRA